MDDDDDEGGVLSVDDSELDSLELEPSDAAGEVMSLA